jgi:hypothetical protein
MPPIENLCTFILNSIPRIMAGMIFVFGLLVLNQLLVEGNDSIGLRLAGLALMISLLVLVKLTFTKKTYKFKLSCLLTSLSLGAFELIEFTKLAILATSACLCKAFSKIIRLVVQLVNSTVSTSIKTVFASHLAAKACLKSALRAIALTLTPKLLLLPNTRRA